MERLSGMDAFFLYFETPTMHQQVTLAAVLDPSGMPGGYSFAAMRSHIANRLHLVPPFTRRLAQVPLRLHHPMWVDDPDFDLDNHVRRAAVVRPGGEEELAELVGQIASVPLDRARPLWEMWLLEGLADDRVALVAKMHHSTLDGVAGVEQMVNFFDLSADTVDLGPPPERHIDAVPSDAELLAAAAVSRVRGLVDVVPLVRRTASSITAVRRNRAEPNTNAGGTPLTGPDTVLNGSISGQRRVAFARVPMAEVKRIKNSYGATVNDVLLATCAGALRRYLEGRGEMPDRPLVAGVPVNVRTEDQSGLADNRVSAMFVPLPVQASDPDLRLKESMVAAAAAKEEHAMFGSDTLQAWAEVADPNVFDWLSNLYSSTGLADRHRPAINLMISNIPGPNFPLYMAGAEMVRAYPMGQIIEGVGLNITMMSYTDSVDFGFIAAANLLPDVWDLAHAVEPSFSELAATVP
jgi:diacylglycerol O-acyltransferase